MSARLGGAFERAKREGRAAFIPYVMAGDPDLATTEILLDALSSAGADVIELGVPYSDPLADGPSIAAAGARALAGGAGLRDALAIVTRCAARCAPLLLFTYFNPVDRFGIRPFAREAAAAGAVGAIVPDVALEESEELREALRAESLAMPLLVAPSTPRERAARIAGASSGFVYVVSRLGVTGASAAPNVDALKLQLATLRELTNEPLAVGFGVHSAQDVRGVARIADGVVVGSALVDAYAGARGAEAARRVTEFVAPLIAAATA
jgi:tryptophan synthase alpha chain